LTRTLTLLAFSILSGTASAASPAESIEEPKRGVSPNGTVLDPSGAVIPGSTVTLNCDGAGGERTILTDSQGAFRFDGTLSGGCEIRVEFEGFKPFVRKVKIGTKPAAPLVIVLAITEVHEEFFVGNDSTSPSTIAGEDRDANRMGAEDLEGLPSLDQDYLATMSRFLSAGSVGTSGVDLVVDGLEANGLKVGASAIQEIKINQDPYSAEYSRPGRGRIEVITKPAPPEYHGNFNVVFRDHHLDARNTFAATKAPEQRRGLEAFLAGPLLGSKTTSFTISATWQDDDLQSVVTALGPSGAIRQNVPTPQRNVDITGRLTRQPNQRTTYSVAYSYEDRQARNRGVGGITLPEAGSNYRMREDEIILNHRTTLTSRLVNQFRLLLGRYSAPTTSLEPGPKIVVADAFVSGGAQADLLRTEHHFTLTEMLSYSRGRHLFKLGINVPDWSRRGIEDDTNAEGTFSFSSLQDYAQGRPYAFVVQRGNGHVVFLEKVLGAFVQDEIRVGPRLALSVGLRYDWQNYFHDNDNFAPRFSFAYRLGKTSRTVLRGGAGLFYDRSGPQPIADILRFDGERFRRYVITNPSYPDPFSQGLAPSATPVSAVRLSPDVQIPYSLHFSTGVERQVGKRATMTLAYTGVRGFHLFRSRDVNAPPPAGDAARPDPSVGVLRQIESAGRLRSDALEVGLRGKVGRFFTGMAQYTLGWSQNDTGGVSYFPADNYDLSGEWGRADFDQRHRLNLLGTIDAGRKFKLGIALSMASGKPYSLTTGRDDNHDGLANDRVPGAGRNTLQGPSHSVLDLRLSRELLLDRSRGDKGPALTLGLDGFNVLNRANYAGFVGNISSPFFGRAVSANPPRKLQVSARFKF